MIHADNADLLKCRILLEGANSPTTPQAEEILVDKGVLVVPDVMANAGGVVVSYFEWVQNLQHFRWDEREVNDKLGTIMRRAYREVMARSKQGGDQVPLRVAAYALGIERVVEAARTRGLHLDTPRSPGYGRLSQTRRTPCRPTAAARVIRSGVSPSRSRWPSSCSSWSPPRRGPGRPR